MTRAIKIAKGLAALGLLVALVGGVPWALWRYVGWPLPHTLPSWSQFTTGLDQRGIPDRVLIDSLACVVWISWAILASSVLAEIPAAVRGRTARRLPVVGPLQPFVGHLAAAVLVAALAVVPRPVAGGGGDGHTPLTSSFSTVRPRQALVAMTLASDTAGPVASPVTNGSEPIVAAPASTNYVVQRGDTLWGIAERQLGDPLRWQEIYQLNEGHPQPDGSALTDPHWIYPGWTLVLPPAEVGPTATSATGDPTPPPAQAPPTVGVATPTPDPPSASKTAETHMSTLRPPANAPDSTSSPAAHRAESAATPIGLPSGSVIAGSFASGVLAALAAGRLRRRRHYRPQPPTSGRHVNPYNPSGGLRDLLVAVRATRHGEDEELTSVMPSEPPPMTAIPDDDALVHPDVIEVGSRDDEVVRLGFCEWPGLSIAGPGAPSVLRAWLAALLAHNGPYGAEIVVVGPFGDRLFGSLELPSLRGVETVEAALSWLESAISARSQRFNDADIADVIGHRQALPEDPLPLLLVVTDVVPESLDARWQAMLESATRIGLAALVLIPEHAMDELSSSNPWITVDEDGSIRQAWPRSLTDLLGGSRLFQLSATDGVDLLAPIASIHADEEFDDLEPSSDRHDSRAEVQLNGNGAEPAAETSDAGSVDWPAAGSQSQPTPIRVELLGTARVEAWGETIASGLRSSAYELLAWYALHPDGATAEAAIEALWPDAPPKRGRERFWNALGNLRSRLRGPDKDGVEILTKVGQHYHPDRSVLDIDLWRFESALSDVTAASERVDRVEALGRASASYGGDFYPTADALWVEPIREDLHRRALDTQIRLAELYVESDQVDAAVAALERTIELDSICEEAYRRLMTLQASVDHDDAAQRTWILLQGRLAELDLEPEVATTDLVREVLNRRPSSAGSRSRSQ